MHPKGLVPLEELFDCNDVAKNPKVIPSDSKVEDSNIVIEEQPKIIKLPKNLSPESKERYVELIGKYSDVFSWRYDDLKVYDANIIQYTIPVKEGQNHLGRN